MAEIILPNASGESLISGPGEFTVPIASAVGDLVYISGPTSAELADYGSILTAPATAVVYQKPAAAVATLLFSGRMTGYAGLTPSSLIFLGLAGGFVDESSLPVGSGNVIQKVGVVVSPTDILFFPHQFIVL